MKQKPHQCGMPQVPQKNNDLPPCIHAVECGDHIEGRHTVVPEL